MVKVYNHGGLVQHADRLVISTNGEGDSYADFCTPQSTQHSCLKNIRKYMLINNGVDFDKLQKYKFYNLWIDTGTHEIYVGDEKDDTPELRDYLSKHEYSIRHAHESFQSYNSPFTDFIANDNWKTSLDANFTEYASEPSNIKKIKTAFRNAHTLSEFKSELSKETIENEHIQIPDVPTGKRVYTSPYQDFMPGVKDYYGMSDIY